MSSRVHKHAVQLKMLRDAWPKLGKQILHHCGKDFSNGVCECVKNVLKGNVPLTSSQKQKLSRHRNKLRELVLKKTPKKKERRFPRRVDNSNFIDSRRIIGDKWIKLRR